MITLQMNVDTATKVLKENLLEQYAKNLAEMSIAEIAREVYKEWKPVHEYAKPYLEAMECLQSIDDNYVADSGRSVVAYFLSNATRFKGEAAKAIKKELNKRLK